MLKSAKKDDSNLAREIHHHRQFIHPHIARLYEVIVTESMVWLVLEYCQGKYKSLEGISFNTHRLTVLQVTNYTITFSNRTDLCQSKRYRGSLPSS